MRPRDPKSLAFSRPHIRIDRRPAIMQDAASMNRAAGVIRKRSILTAAGTPPRKPNSSSTSAGAGML
jgi:hypothetical protein